MNVRRLAVVGLVVAGLAGMGGCASRRSSGRPELGVYHYGGGDLTTTEAVSLDKAFAATYTAIRDLEFDITIQDKDALNARVFAEMADQKVVRVRLFNKGDMVTDFQVRVGWFGDEAMSRVIMDRIKKSL